MAFEAWSIYGARLPNCELRMAVKDTIHEHFTSWTGPALAENAQFNISCSAAGVHQVVVDRLVSSHATAQPKSDHQMPGLSNAAKQIEDVHQAVLQTILSNDFLNRHGFYGNSSAWKDKWLQ